MLRCRDTWQVPFDAESVLAIDPDMQTVGLLYENALPAECAGMRGKWSGGVISAKDGCMYCVPFNAPSVLKVFEQTLRPLGIPLYSCSHG